MSRIQRILIASGLLVIAVFALVAITSQIGMTWYQAPDETGIAAKQVAVFEPAVVGTVVAALAVLALLAHLLVVARRTVSRWMWLAAVAASIVTVVAAVAGSTADRPTF
jgi:cytochrome bd-type quinol oxidase subunit 2